MSVAPRFSLRSTGTPAFSSTRAYISPSKNSSVKFLELTTTLRPLPVEPVPEVAVALSVEPVVPAVGVDGTGVGSLPQAVSSDPTAVIASSARILRFNMFLLQDCRLDLGIGAAPGRAMRRKTR